MPPAGAPGGGPARVDVIGIAGGSPEDLALVGSGGEIYRREAGKAWKRSTGGAVAAELVVARGPSTKEIWALGGSLPPYQYDGATWSAQPLAQQGAGIFSSGGAYAVAVARRVLVYSQSRWNLLPTTGTTGTTAIVAVWAAGPCERVKALLAGATGQVFAVGDAGSIVKVGAAATTALALEPRLGAFAPRLSAAAGGKVYLVGAGTVEGT